MRILLQRVAQARVSVEEQVIAEIGPGLANKIANLRIFEDQDGKMNRSLLDAGGSALVVSQFTLFADTRKGRRPSFTGSAPPAVAEPLVERFAALLEEMGIPTQTGEFGAHMLVEIANDGPVTIFLER
jgi:D-tyrosyl-tRNA(Tyr) deacylase